MRLFYTDKDDDHSTTVETKKSPISAKYVSSLCRGTNYLTGISREPKATPYILYSEVAQAGRSVSTSSSMLH